MADDKALPPGENQDQGAPEETLEVTSPVPVGDGAVTKNPDETQSTVLQDPTRRRDTNTASLKRLRPEDFNSTGGDADDSDNTETVNIKVIKEQKKQFRNMMTSSQTLAVNPDGSPEEAPAPAETQPANKATLKIKAPQAETRTESIVRPNAGGATTQQPTANPKSTLKIKAPPGVAPAQAGAAKPGATLKIKAPAAAPAGQPNPAAQTIKQAAPVRPGKTLKLRPGQATTAATPARRTGAADQYAASAVAPETSASPGIAYTIISVAGVAACVVVLFKVCTSMNELFNGLNIFDKTLY